MSLADRLLSGAIDMHVHSGPDSLAERRLDALQLAHHGRQAGMGGFVLKSHCYPTLPVAYLLNQLVPEITVFGSLCLDIETGGINLAAVEASAAMGAKVLWMPTLSASTSRAALVHTGPITFQNKGINIIEDDLVGEIRKILMVVEQHQMVLATGHLSPEETSLLVREAKTAGVSRVVITHPLSLSTLGTKFTLEGLKYLADGGAYIEHCFLKALPSAGQRPIGELVEAIKFIGPERCIMSTDLGQDVNPPAPEGLRMYIASMLKAGLSADAVELMVKTNPAKLLGVA